MDRVYNMIFGSRHRAPTQQQQQYCFTIGEINERLQSLCSPVSGPHSQGRRITEKGVREIQTLLKLLDDRRNRFDDAQWAWRPRLYAILHNLQAIEFMDDFIREHITDFNLPFNEQTLPQFIGGKEEGVNLRLAFFAIQDYYLTEVKDIESEKSLHLTLPVSGDTYFISQRPLGQGSFGSVDLVFSRLSTDSFARKRVLRFRGSEQSQKDLIQELRELRRLNHQHLVQIIGSYTDTEYIAYLMKPVASSTLAQFLNTPQALKNHEKDLLRPFYGCLAGAMNYLYAHQIRHRDLTARNILIDSSWKIYISDFGSSYSWEFKPSSKTKHRNVPTSPDYMAPEVAKEEERGTRSDMWSLGIVFLEMTTKLLDHRLVSLRDKIRQNASKEKVQPYPYANMTVIINWMKTLGTTNTDYEHDKEPLGWIRELLHLEHEHRLTPPQLMQYIFESPSLHAFCCLKCIDDFRNQSFAYNLTGPRKDAKEDSERTRQEVEEAFASNPLKMQLGGISHKETASIERWIENSYPLETSAVELPTPDYPESPRNFDDTQDFDPIRADQFLYNIYEHEFYNPTYLSGHRENQPLDTDPFPSFYPTEPVELLGDTAWADDYPNESWVNPKSKAQGKLLQDSNLGFLEVVSNSTDDDDHEAELPFEECSDRSSVHSEEMVPIQVPNGPLHVIYEYEALREVEMMTKELVEKGEIQFDEEEDKSDTEHPWDEASDRSESSDDPQADKHGVINAENPSTDDAETLIGEQPELANEASPSSSMTTETLIASVEVKEIETDNLSASPLEITEASLPTTEEHSENEDKISATPSRDNGVPLLVDKRHVGKADNVQDLPLSNVPPNALPDPTLGPSGNSNKADKKREPGGKKGHALISNTKTKPQKKARSIEKAVYIDGKKPRSDVRLPTLAIPDIVINGVSNAQPEEPRLSKNNLRHIGGGIRPPIVPRKRNALMPIDARKLMENTWEMASSAPTSVLSEESKSKISKFFFMIPNDREIENLLSFYFHKQAAILLRPHARRPRR
ncbi:hypothetical protein NUW58_g4696 [Xylaria curta]|uniref:Uncharacterized protein n=1 Tax=Xylaria curta TaxID=42375 RepID=A0ACC1P7Z0_9PEZI|nr:hypothetical protein NUW58_g4696 [Xylaria curta]